MTIVNLLRLNQWIKNLLVFSSLFFAKKLFEWDKLLINLKVFFCFSFIASIGYIWNDWRDRETDKLHPIKKMRPIAAGQISLLSISVIVLTLITLTTTLLISFNISTRTLLLTYFVLTLSYSAGIKQIPVLEMFYLSIGFMLRPLAGAVALGLPISKWFISVIGFGSLFIVGLKRISEFQEYDRESTRKVVKEYDLSFLNLVVSSTLALSLSAYTLWAFQSDKADFYTELSIIPTTFIVLRFSWHRERGELESPEQIIFKDRVLLVSIVTLIIVLFIGLYI